MSAPAAVMHSPASVLPTLFPANLDNNTGHSFKRQVSPVKSQNKTLAEQNTQPKKSWWKKLGDFVVKAASLTYTFLKASFKTVVKEGVSGAQAGAVIGTALGGPAKVMACAIGAGVGAAYGLITGSIDGIIASSYALHRMQPSYHVPEWVKEMERAVHTGVKPGQPAPSQLV